MSEQMSAPGSIDRIGALPPQRIADTLLPGHSAKDRRLTAMLIHLGIGAGSGLIYLTLIRPRRANVVARIAHGAAFGVAVWVVGYEVVVPALGVLPRADRDVATRRTALLEAHVVYGAALGAFS